MGRKRNNSNEAGGRTAKARGVSFPEELSQAVDRRLGELYPFVSGLSQYVQRLIYLDLNRGLLREDGSINEGAVLKVKDAKGGRSFNSPHNAIATPDAGVDFPGGTFQGEAAGRDGVVAQLAEHHNGIVSFPPEFPAAHSPSSPGSTPAKSPHKNPVGLVMFAGDSPETARMEARDFSQKNGLDSVGMFGFFGVDEPNSLPNVSPTAFPNPSPASDALLRLAA